METTMIVSLIYLFLAINTTYFVGRSLYTYGEYFLESIFANRSELVQPINKILLIGFYLVNIGFVLLFLTQKKNITGLISCIEFLIVKMGTVYLVLGLMHMFNLFVFITIEKRFNKLSKTKF